MKKTISLSLCCLTALTVSARNSGPDETTLNILSIIFLVFGVLQIILFFKIWGMTNDVKKLTEHLTHPQLSQEDDTDIKMRWLLLKDEVDSAEELLLSQFAKNVEQSYDFYTRVQGLHQELAFTQDITSYVDTLKKNYKVLGKDIPEKIASMKTIGDYVKQWYLPEA